MSFLQKAIIALTLSTTCLFAEASFVTEEILKIESEPLAIFDDGFNLNVLTKGIDSNGNGTFEDGETKSKWLKYSQVGDTFEYTVFAEFDDFLFDSIDKYEFNQFTSTLAILADGEVFILKESTKEIQIATGLPSINDFAFSGTDNLEKNLYMLSDEEPVRNIIYSTDINSIVGTSTLDKDYRRIEIDSTSQGFSQVLASYSGDILAIDLDGINEPLDITINALLDDIFITNNSLKSVYDIIDDPSEENNYIEVEDLSLPEAQRIVNTSVSNKIENIFEFGDGTIINTEEEIVFQRDYKTEFRSLENNLDLTNWKDSYLVYHRPNSNFLVFMEYVERDFLEQYFLVNVGKQPVKSYWDGKQEQLHVFCLGNDANFNGMMDEGDENPSWWVLEYGNGAWDSQKVREFEFGSLQFPFRPAIDSENDLLYIPHPGRVAQYDMIDYSELDDELWTGNAIAIEIAGPHLLFTVSGSVDEPGEIIVYDDLNSFELQSIETEINPQKSLYFNYDDKFWFAVLNNGSFADNKSVLQVGVLPHMQDPTFTNYAVGLTANDLAFKNGKVYVVANGSHQLFRIDILEEEIESFNLGSNGFDGPREIEVISEDEAIITSYSGVLLNYNKEITEISPIDTDYRIENIEYLDGDFFGMSMAISAPFFSDYSSNNQVFILGIFNTSVKEFDSKQVQKLSVFPAPASGNFSIEIDGNISRYELEIYDINGNKKYSTQATKSRVDLNTQNLGLNAGTYFARIVENGNAYSIKFNVKN